MPDNGGETALGLLDLHDADIDFPRRWSRAAELAQTGAPAVATTASILIHDVWPERPYAIRLGGMLEHLQR